MSLIGSAWTWFLGLIDRVERAPWGPGQVFAVLVGVIALRNLLEVAVAQNPVFNGLAAFVHYPLAYVGPFLSLTLVLAFWGRVAPSRVAKLMILAWLLTLSPPLVDMIFDHHPETPTIGYLQIDPVDLPFVLVRFFDLSVPLTGTTEGIRIETMAAVLLGALYVAIRARSALRAVAAAATVYLVSLFWFTLPVLVQLAFQAFLPRIGKSDLLRGEAIVNRLTPDSAADSTGTFWLVLVLAGLALLWRSVERAHPGEEWFGTTRLANSERCVSWGIEIALAAAFFSGFNAVLWLRYHTLAFPVFAPYDFLAPAGACLGLVLLVRALRDVHRAPARAAALALLGTCAAIAAGTPAALGMQAAAGLLAAVFVLPVDDRARTAVRAVAVSLASMAAFAAGFALVIGRDALARFPPALAGPWLLTGLTIGLTAVAFESPRWRAWAPWVLVIAPAGAALLLRAPVLLVVGLPLGALAAWLVWLARDPASTNTWMRHAGIAATALATLVIVRAGLSNEGVRAPIERRFACVARLERLIAGDLLDEGKIDPAKTRYRAALSCEPQHIESLRGLGMALAKEGKLTRGIELVEEAAALAPNSARYHGDLSGLYLAAGRPADALAAAERTLALDPRSLLALFNRARAHEELGDRAAAIAAWTAYVDLGHSRVEHEADVAAARKRVRALERGEPLPPPKPNAAAHPDGGSGTQ